MLKKKFGNLFKILAEFFNFFIVALLYMEGTCKRNIFRSIQHIPLTTRFCKRDPSEYTLLLVFTYVHFQQTKVLESLVTYIEYDIIACFLQFQQCSVLEFVVKHIAYHCLCFIVLCTFESVVLVNHFPQTLQADEDVERGAQGNESAVGPSFFARTLLTGLHIFISLVTNDNFQLRTCDPSLCPRVLPI